MATVTVFKNPVLPRALVLGTLGGVALILVSAFSTRGPLIFVPYAALLAALAALLVRHRTEAFVVRFSAGLFAFLLATAIVWLYIVLVANPHVPSIADVWRLALVVGIGAVLTAAVAYVTE